MSESEEPDYTESRQDMLSALHQAIQRTVNEFAEDAAERGVLTHWVAALEMVGDDGNLWFTHVFAPGQKVWQGVGLAECLVEELKTSWNERED